MSSEGEEGVVLASTPAASQGPSVIGIVGCGNCMSLALPVLALPGQADVQHHRVPSRSICQILRYLAWHATEST